MKLILCGPPGVGKTTIAERLRYRLGEASYDFRLLHSDDFSRNTYEQMYERVTDTDPSKLANIRKRRFGEPERRDSPRANAVSERTKGGP